MDGLKFDDWWFHGVKGATPNEAMELPAGWVSLHQIQLFSIVCTFGADGLMDIV